jgi:hypothetical protein
MYTGIKLAMQNQKKQHEPKIDPHDYDSKDNRPLHQEWATGPTGLLHARYTHIYMKICIYIYTSICICLFQYIYVHICINILFKNG